MSHDISNFAKDVIDKSFTIPVLADFWAEWCGPCKVLGPVLERLASQNTDNWLLAKINTEQHKDIASQYGIRGIPNVKLFVDGKVVDEFTGALPEAQIISWLNKALPSKWRHKVKEAEALLQAGKTTEAQSLLNDVLINEPDNHEARLSLAQSCLYDDPQLALEMLKPVEPDSPVFEMAEGYRTLARLFTLQTTPEQLPEGESKAAYIKAIAHIKKREYESALKGFIALVQSDRSYDDDGARKACIALFKVLGSENELTREYRTTLSRSLYI